MQNTELLAREGIPKFPQSFPNVGGALSIVREGIPKIPKIPAKYNDGWGNGLRYDTNKREDLEDRLLAVTEAYEERAAILEFDADTPREEAERLAREMTHYRGW